MAVRPIDGNELYRIEKLLDTDIVRQDKVALNLLEQVLYDIQHVPTLTPPNEWVSVEERLPKYNIREDGELISSKILCYCETDKTVHLVVSQKFYTGRKGEIVHPVFRYYDEWGDEIENVSHWMPLPAPPDKDNHVPAKAPNEPLSILVLDEPDREYIDYICPRCKSIISQRRRGQRMETMYKCKFHDNCGQRVDWSNPQPYNLKGGEENGRTTVD